MASLYRTASVRAIERRWVARLPDGALMQRAAAAVADGTARLARTLPARTPILALVGPGNNGGDALLAALALRGRGFAVSAVSLAGRAPETGDAAGAWREAAAAGLAPLPPSAFDAELARSPLVVDGLFGIGLARPLEGEALRWARALAAAAAPVVAVDVPSGLDADTGAIVGDAAAVRARVTVTMLGDKPGLRTGRALDHAGEIVVAPLVEDAAGAAGVAPDGELLERARAAALLPRRARDSNKGSFGGVLVAGGSPGMAGAALLAARGAQCAGAGRTWIASPAGPVFDPGQPQLMTRDAAGAVPDGALLAGVDAVVLGCGLGAGEHARAWVAALLGADRPLVIDADALNAIASDPALATLLASRGAAAVLTPHPLEAARLLGTSAAAVQKDRIGAACALAARLRATVVLKGAGSVVADAGGAWAIVGAGGPSLATAGTGDVLAGAIGALIAQGCAPGSAARLGAWAHAAAGDRFARSHAAQAGLSAAELPELLRAELNDLAGPALQAEPVSPLSDRR